MNVLFVLRTFFQFNMPDVLNTPELEPSIPPDHESKVTVDKLPQRIFHQALSHLGVTFFVLAQYLMPLSLPATSVPSDNSTGVL
jgi:hypothetical protein